MDVCRGFRYFIIFLEYWKFNTPKNSINDAAKKIFFSILHSNPSIQRPATSGVEGCSRQVSASGWMNWVREDRTDSGKHPNTSVGSELTQWRKGGAGNTGTSPLPAKSSILDGHLACYKLNAACFQPTDGGVRLEYDQNKKFWRGNLSSSWIC